MPRTFLQQCCLMGLLALGCDRFPVQPPASPDDPGGIAVREESILRQTVNGLQITVRGPGRNVTMQTAAANGTSTTLIRLGSPVPVTLDDCQNGASRITLTSLTGAPPPTLEASVSTDPPACVYAATSH